MKKSIKYVHTNTGTCMSIAALCVIVPNWRQLRYPQVGEWVNNVAYPFSGTLLSNEKEQTTDNNTRAHYCAERKEPVRREDRWCDSIHKEFQEMKLNRQWQQADWKLVRGESGCRTELRRGTGKLLGVLDLFVVLVVVYTLVKMDKILYFKQFMTLHFSLLNYTLSSLPLSFIHTFKCFLKTCGYFYMLLWSHLEGVLNERTI